MISIAQRFVPVVVGLSLVFAIAGCGDQSLTSDEHLQNAKAFLDDSDNASAIVELKNALQKDVHNSRARALLGLTYYDNGDYPSAEKELSRAYEKGVDSAVVIPTLSRALLNLGEFKKLASLRTDTLDPEGRSEVQAARALALLYQGDIDGAEVQATRAIENQPASLYAEVAYARLEMARKEFEASRKRLDSVFAIDDKYAPAWNVLGDLESAEKHPKEAAAAYTKVLEFSPSSFDARLNRAMMLIHQKKYGLAKKDLNFLRKGAGSAKNVHPGVHFALGIVQVQEKNLAGAKISFSRVAEYSDAYPLAYYYLAALDYEDGGHEQAMRHVYRFLGLVPGSVVGTKLAARLELDDDNFDKVETLLRPVVNALPDDIEALNLLANALLAKGKSGEGVEMLARVAELQPDSSQAKARLGAGYIAAGNEELGVATLRDLTKIDPQYEQADILLVLNFLRNGQLDEALEAGTTYAKRNPDSATSFNLLGKVHLARAEQEAASKAFAQADTLNPGDPGANHGLADFALQKNQFKQAREYYRKVLEHHPDHQQTMMRLAGSYALEGDEGQLMESLNNAQRAHPRSAEPRLVKARYYIAKGKLEQAAPLLDELTEEQKQLPDALVTIAGFELAATRYNQALKTLDKLISIRPAVSQYHYLKSKAHAGLGEVDEFTSELKRAIELDPEHFYAKVALARLSHVQGDHEQFDRLLSQLRETAPDNPDVVKLEVFAAQKRGDNKTAETLLVQLYDQMPTTSNVVSLAAHRSANDNVAGAVALLEGWLKQHEKDLKVREQLAALYSSQGDTNKVIKQYQAILKEEEGNVVALNNLAWYLLETDPEESLEHAQKAFALVPDSSSVLDTLALALLANDRVVEARRIIDRALEKADNNPDILYHDALIRMAEGDSRGARDQLEGILESKAAFSERVKAEALLARIRKG